jgi:uroporphyrinogen-III synthase
LRQGLTRLRVAAVGPVVGAALEKLGLSVAAMPATSFHLKPLIGALIDAFATSPPSSLK